MTATLDDITQALSQIYDESIVSWWPRVSLPTFGNATTLQLLTDGRGDEVLAFVNELINLREPR